MNNVNSEVELYDPMKKWLYSYLSDKYKRSEIIAVDAHSVTLDKVLEEYGVIHEYPQVVGLNIQIDVLGIIKKSNRSDIVFIEAKKEKLNLHHLGQLWAYCKLCNPLEAFLFSSGGMGSLDKILKNLHREDILDFGDKKKIKKMIVSKWDIHSQNPDYRTMVPKL